uniref:Transmembrane protein 276 n=1 Tax=Leptobrachium leishanense TaxID=445787 RepID=A0A8C5QH31_9ANUR
MMEAAAVDLHLIASQAALCVVSLYSALRSHQVHRAAAAGFLLHALGSACSLSLVLFYEDPMPSSGPWVAIVIGFPLLAFAFFWMSGDQSTANMLLGASLLVAAGSENLPEESRCMVANYVIAAASLSVLVLSIFIGNVYGVLGSLTLAVTGLLKAEISQMVPKEVASTYGQTVSLLAFSHALASHHLDYVCT